MQFNANKTLSSGKRMGKKFIKGGRSALSEVAIVQLLRGHPEHWLSTADILEGLSRPAQWNTANPALVDGSAVVVVKIGVCLPVASGG